ACWCGGPPSRTCSSTSPAVTSRTERPVATPPWVRVFAYFGRAYRRTWRASIMTTFVNPVLYLAAMGVGLGPFINTGGHTPILVLPVGVLTGMAFATPLAAFSASQENEEAFPLVFRLGVIPLFLFSGVFFPISQLPTGLRVVAYATPLWHGVNLCRSLTLGQV